MRQLVDHLQARDFRICGVFIIDSQFMVEPSKFVSGLLSALSAMVTLEITHVNVMTKLDILSKSARKRLDEWVGCISSSKVKLILTDQIFHIINIDD